MNRRERRAAASTGGAKHIQKAMSDVQRAVGLLSDLKSLEDLPALLAEVKHLLAHVSGLGESLSEDYASLSKRVEANEVDQQVNRRLLSVLATRLGVYEASQLERFFEDNTTILRQQLEAQEADE